MTSYFLFPTGHKPKMISEFKYTTISKKLYRLDAELLWYDGKTLISIPSGFHWDGTSVPYILQWYEGVNDHLAASCIHDWLYNYHFCSFFDEKSNMWLYAKCTKRYADIQWWLILHKYYKAELGRDFTLTMAIVLFGWFYWNTNNCKLNCKKCSSYKNEVVECPLYKHNLEIQKDIILDANKPVFIVV